MFLNNNNISFSVYGGESVLQDLQSRFFPEFSIYSHDQQDHLAEVYRVRSNLLNDSDSEDVVKSKIKTLCHLFRGAIFLINREHSMQEFTAHQIFLGEGCAQYIDSETSFTNDFSLPKYDNDFCQLIDLNTTINFYLHLAFRDGEFFRCLLFASDRFDYIDLYRIMECIKNTNENRVLRDFKDDLDKFTCSANNFTATGFASRHATGSKDIGVQKRFISLSDSRNLFKKIIAGFAKERAKLIGIKVEEEVISEKLDWDW